MFDLYIAVTDRLQCKDDFLKQIEKITSYSLQAIILREKDLGDTAYQRLAAQVLEVCRVNSGCCILYDRVEIARKLGCPHIHLSMEALRAWVGRLGDFDSVGATCSTSEEAQEAKKLGAHYIILGPIFPDRAYAGQTPRGLSFLQDVCHKTGLPVYAVGGVKPARMPEVLNAGALGGCMVSEFMML